MATVPADPVVHVVGFDHLVLRCADVEASLAWYTGELGLAGMRIDEWRAGAVPFPSVRVDEGTIIDLIARRGEPTEPNLDHLCLVVDDGGVDAVPTSGRFTVVDGPARRFGARGDGWSVYVLDPDRNVIELRSYPTHGC
jgi:catechol 2,3-dioxygenase-like lactoylglutathione lyase family enzyme